MELKRTFQGMQVLIRLLTGQLKIVKVIFEISSHICWGIDDCRLTRRWPNHEFIWSAKTQSDTVDAKQLNRFFRDVLQLVYKSL